MVKYQLALLNSGGNSAITVTYYNGEVGWFVFVIVFLFVFCNSSRGWKGYPYLLCKIVIETFWDYSL